MALCGNTRMQLRTCGSTMPGLPSLQCSAQAAEGIHRLRPAALGPILEGGRSTATSPMTTPRAIARPTLGLGCSAWHGGWRAHRPPSQRIPARKDHGMSSFSPDCDFGSLLSLFGVGLRCGSGDAEVGRKCTNILSGSESDSDMAQWHGELYSVGCPSSAAQAPQFGS